jgi:superfamily II DNA or RNA helicase
MLYQVTPVKGDPYIVNSQHILSLRTTGSNEIVNIGVEDYLQKSKTFKHCAKGWRSYAIPFSEKFLEVDPYILGIWLGDGTTLQPAISTMDQEVVDSIYEYANDNGHRVSIWHDKRCNTYRICDNGFFAKLKGLGVIGNKHIPNKYKTGSIEQRLQLMAGIIDTDGYLSRGTYDLVLKQKEFAHDVCFVARSLGLAAYATQCTKGIKDRNFSGTYYRITISGDIDKIPCRVARRKASPRRINKSVLNVGITVTPVGQGKYFGFAIDGPDKLFLLGDFTVTHNTECSIYLMKATADNYKRAVMLMDRIVLVDQTSSRLQKYNLEHGVYQADHWRYRPLERLQVCSAQTLERRDNFPQTDLLIIDEVHVQRRQTIEFIKSRPDMKVIGLTATPFTKGLGDVYTHVVNGSTTDFLVTNKWLAPLRVYIAKEIDMTGAKKVAGEWSQDVATERGMKITGDIVESWITKTHEVFGRPRKTIVFCSGVQHGADLVAKFAERGYNFVSISYKDDDEFKRQAIEDFSKPDTTIHGLIATDILTRGFDVPDVMIGVSARPFSKSFSSHVQQMGRVMRSYPDKEYGLWLCHSGNFIRFREDWEEVFHDGVKELDDSKEKARKEPTEKEKKESKCPACGHLWPKAALSCPACGHVKPRRSLVSEIPGELQELGQTVRRDDRQSFYSQLIYIANDRGYAKGWAAHKYKEKFGVWPRGLQEVTKVPEFSTMNWIRSRQIAWGKSKRRTA